MPHACRTPLRALAERPAFEHPGLALQRYLTENGDNHEAAKQLLRRVADSTASPPYRAAYHRYRTALQDCACVELTLAAPMAVGLGISSPLEVGLATLHTYGMPYIPGSAVKGICRDVAERQLRQEKIGQPQFDAVFGKQEEAGLCVFFDAWYVPGSAPDDKPFHRDVVTVHHPDYYGQRGAWPTDFDDPNPVPFIVVKPGARFLFAVRPPCCPDGEQRQKWIEYLKELVTFAMTKHGAGGKINAGYGWFTKPKKEDGNGPPPPPPPDTIWRGVTVTYSPGNGEVSCASQQDKAAARLADVKVPDTVRENLKTKKRLPGATVKVQKVGNAWRIVEITSDN